MRRGNKAEQKYVFNYGCECAPQRTDGKKMKTKLLIDKLWERGIEDYTGIPDSALQGLCSYLNKGEDRRIHHYVPANEGNAAALAMGIYLATGKIGCVYMQNSGIGNMINPVTSLMHEQVYGIPALFLIGWRGEPGTKDEPQHKFMGKITKNALDCLEIENWIIDKDTTEEQLEQILDIAFQRFQQNKQFALIAKKGTFEEEKKEYHNDYSLVREEAIAEILKNIGRHDIVISTTGKISREVYEQGEALFGDHRQTFLTVGGMGHASMIAFGMAVKRPDKKVYCLDGDGAVLMHMGSLACLGKEKPDNLVHICLNNEAHESVGGMPTGAVSCSYADIAAQCGYRGIYKVADPESLASAVQEVSRLRQLSFIEVQVKLGAREDLGRPKESAQNNKKIFMEYHKTEEE